MTNYDFTNFTTLEQYNQECLNRYPTDMYKHLYFSNFKPYTFESLLTAISGHIMYFIDRQRLSFGQAFGDDAARFESFNTIWSTSQIIPFTIDDLKKILIGLDISHRNTVFDDDTYKILCLLKQSLLEFNQVYTQAKDYFFYQNYTGVDNFRLTLRDSFKEDITFFDLAFMYMLYEYGAYELIYDDEDNQIAIADIRNKKRVILKRNIAVDVSSDIPETPYDIKYKASYFSFMTKMTKNDLYAMLKTTHTRLNVSSKIITGYQAELVKVKSETKIQEFTNPYSWS